MDLEPAGLTLAESERWKVEATKTKTSILQEAKWLRRPPVLLNGRNNQLCAPRNVVFLVYILEKLGVREREFVAA